MPARIEQKAPADKVHYYSASGLPLVFGGWPGEAKDRDAACYHSYPILFCEWKGSNHGRSCITLDHKRGSYRFRLRLHGSVPGTTRVESHYLLQGHGCCKVISLLTFLENRVG